MGRGFVAGVLVTVALVGCADEPAPAGSAAEIGEAFLRAVYDGDTATIDRLSDGDLEEVRFFSAFVVRLGGVTSSVSCDEPDPGLAACRVTGSDRVIETLAPDDEAAEVWDLEIADGRVVQARFNTILPPPAAEFYDTLIDADPDFLDICGDFGANGDPVGCAEVVLAALEDTG